MRNVMERRTRTTPTQAWGAGAISGIYTARCGPESGGFVWIGTERSGGWVWHEGCRGLGGKGTKQVTTAERAKGPRGIEKSPQRASAVIVHNGSSDSVLIECRSRRCNRSVARLGEASKWQGRGQVHNCGHDSGPQSKGTGQTKERAGDDYQGTSPAGGETMRPKGSTIDFLCAHITTKAMPEVGSKVALSTPQTLENNGGDGRIANPNGRVLRPAFTQGGRRARRGRIYKRRGKEERSATSGVTITLSQRRSRLQGASCPGPRGRP